MSIWHFDRVMKCHLHACTEVECFIFLSLLFRGEDWMSCTGLHLHQLVLCVSTNLRAPQHSCWYHRKHLFIATLQEASNNAFDPVWFHFWFLRCFCFSARHEVITKEILELDTWENQWNVVAINVLMHDSYDVCLVARLNPRDLIPPPPDLVDQ